MCKAAFPSKKKPFLVVVFFKSSQRTRLDLYVKDKTAHRMKCIKLLNELPDVTGPTVR